MPFLPVLTIEIDKSESSTYLRLNALVSKKRIHIIGKRYEGGTQCLK